jgi:hypothetical protein
VKHRMEIHRLALFSAAAQGLSLRAGRFKFLMGLKHRGAMWQSGNVPATPLGRFGANSPEVSAARLLRASFAAGFCRMRGVASGFRRVSQERNPCGET